MKKVLEWNERQQWTDGKGRASPLKKTCFSFEWSEWAPRKPRKACWGMNELWNSWMESTAARWLQQLGEKKLMKSKVKNESFDWINLLEPGGVNNSINYINSNQSQIKTTFCFEFVWLNGLMVDEFVDGAGMAEGRLRRFINPQTQTSLLQSISWRWMKLMKEKWVCGGLAAHSATAKTTHPAINLPLFHKEKMDLLGLLCWWAEWIL